MPGSNPLRSKLTSACDIRKKRPKVIVLIHEVGLGAVAFGLFLASDCEDTTETEVKSPDGKYVATLYERDCGATTDFSTIVKLRESSASFKGDDLGTFVVNGQPKIHLTWDSNTRLRQG